MRASIVRIGHVGLVVSDLDRAIEFYEGELGLRLTERFDYGEAEVGHGVAVSGGAFLRCDTTHHCLSLFTLRGESANGAAPNEGHELGVGLHHIAFELPTPAELLAAYRRMKERGVPIVNARRGGPGNQPRFYARDPDGNLLEFYWGIDHVGWDGRPRVYGPIEEIDLEAFDFEAFERARDEEAAATSERW